MISHHHKCVFIHIPKNAGQSIEHVFLNLLGLTWETRAPLLLRPNNIPELGPPRLAHLKANEYVRYKYLPQDMFDDYYKFTFVRNPWTRMISFYRYLGYDKKYDFKTFLKGTFQNEVFKKKHWFVGPQSEYVCSKEGKVLVDFVGKFESLQTDFDHVCKNLGLSQIQVPHVNETKDRNTKFNLKPRDLAKNILTKMTSRNFPSFKNYQEYYDQESIDLVAKLYKKDIELFNYDFN